MIASTTGDPLFLIILYNQKWQNMAEIIQMVSVAYNHDISDVDIHYQSVYLAPEHVNKKLRCVIDHVSLNEPQEVSIDVKFDAENAIKVSRSSGVFVGFLALISLVAFLTLMLAW